MSNDEFREETTTYSMKVKDKYIFIDNVPVTININTGAYLFSANTLNKIANIVSSKIQLDDSTYYNYEDY